MLQVGWVVGRGQKEACVKARDSERCLKSPLALATARMASEAMTVPVNAVLFFTLRSKIPVSRAKDSWSVDFFAPSGNKLQKQW